MKLSLIGMSNSGKTYWAKRLEEKGFRYFSCDEFIEKKLERELEMRGYSGINDVARWMGQPYDSHYKEASRRYLAIEIEAMETIISLLENDWLDKENVVIDTTGSVIYTREHSMEQLKRKSTIIYLDTPENVKKEMYRLYIENPKPVIWGESFMKRENESEKEALARCYPTLLDYRTKQYKKWANVRLNYYLLRSHNFTVDNFLYLVEQWSNRSSL